MALAPISDLLPADWIVASGVPWERLVSFGPSGFADYARVRFLPDPAYEGQIENDVDWNAVPCASDQWVALLELLSAHTRTANECYLCLWEGWPFPQSVLQGPKLTIPDRARVPYRAYFLFRGPLSDACDWGTAEMWPGEPPRYEPAFVWPADHAWCVANDVDPHWA